MSYEHNVAGEVKKLTIGSLAALAVGMGIILAVNFKTSPQGGTAGRPVHPEPLVTLPPEQVKALIAEGVSDIVLMQGDHIKQVVGLFADGRYEAGIPMPEKPPVQGGLPTSPGLSDFVVKPAAQRLSCDYGCDSCSSRNCRKSSGSCRNC